MNIADYKRILAPLQSNTLQLRMTFLKQVSSVHRLRASWYRLRSLLPSARIAVLSLLASHLGSPATWDTGRLDRQARAGHALHVPALHAPACAAHAVHGMGPKERHFAGVGAQCTGIGLTVCALKAEATLLDAGAVLHAHT